MATNTATSQPAAGIFHHHVAGRIDHVVVVTGAALETVVTGPAIQGITQTVADQGIGCSVAIAVIAVVAQDQLLDLGIQRRGSAVAHGQRIEAATCQFRDGKRLIADIENIAVVAGAADQGVRPNAIEERVDDGQHVGSSATGQGD